MVELAAVNRSVVGSNPTLGAIFYDTNINIFNSNNYIS